MTTSSGKVYCDGMINKQTSPFKNYSIVIRFLSFNPFWILVRVQNSAWDFWGLHFGPWIFGFRFKLKGFFLCFNLCPYSHLT